MLCSLPHSPVMSGFFMEKAFPKCSSHFPFKKVSRGILNTEPAQPSPKQLKNTHVKCACRENFCSKSLYLKTLFYLWSISFLSSLHFCNFLPLSQYFGMCGSLFTLFHISLLPSKVKKGLKIVWEWHIKGRGGGDTGEGKSNRNKSRTYPIYCNHNIII